MKQVIHGGLLLLLPSAWNVKLYVRWIPGLGVLHYLTTHFPPSLVFSLLGNGCRPQPRQQYVRVAIKNFFKKSPLQKQ